MQFRYSRSFPLREAAMSATTPEQVEEVLQKYALYKDPNFNKLPDINKGYIISNIKSEIADHAGGYSLETRIRVEELFNCTHPMFGKAVLNGAPTSQEAYWCGLYNMNLEEVRRMMALKATEP